MTSENNSLQPNDSVEAALRLIDQLAENITVLSGMLARLNAHNPALIEQVMEQRPELPRDVYLNLIRVGEKSLHPDLLTARSVGEERLAQLPFADQSRILAQRKVELVIEGGDTLMVPIHLLTPKQCAQVFSKTGLNSRDEQLAWIRRDKARIAHATIAPADTPAYEVKGKHVVFFRPCELSGPELAVLLGKLSR